MQEIAGVNGIEIDKKAIEGARYDIYGRLLTKPTKGVNIVKMSNVTTRKVIVKLANLNLQNSHEEMCHN